MYIRKKKNKSGSVSIQIIQKKNSKYKVVETIGCAKSDEVLNILLQEAHKRLVMLDPTLIDYSETLSPKKLSNKHTKVIGDELILGKIFQDIQCHTINFEKKKEKELLRYLVLSRLLYPGSKLYLIDYLMIYKKERIDKNKIYRFLDKVYNDNLQQQIQQCVFNHTKKIMSDTISISFYDVTTLYFESESEDDLRRIGFSKEGKLARPQIQLGLFTTLQGYPLSYEVYEGNKYEGHTLIDILHKFQTKFQLEQKPIVIADRVMLTNENIAYLENNDYKYILAAKIKNMTQGLKNKITKLTFLDDGVIHTLEIEKELHYKDKNNQKHTLQLKQRLILTYSSQRAKKDRYNREKALKKLQTKIEKSSSITKDDLKSSSYAKYLRLQQNCNVGFALNEAKIQEDSKLDGVKGFITNDFSISPQDVIAHYQNQYEVERAFRISKTDLKIRPIYHRLENRIKAHILISFVAYAIYKEFERKIKDADLEIKFKLTFDYIKTMYGYQSPFGVEPYELDAVQQKIYNAVYNPGN
jgi:hypothetical protein